MVHRAPSGKVSILAILNAAMRFLVLLLNCNCPINLTEMTRIHLSAVRILANKEFENNTQNTS